MIGQLLCRLGIEKVQTLWWGFRGEEGIPIRFGVGVGHWPNHWAKPIFRCFYVGPFEVRWIYKDTGP